MRTVVIKPVLFAAAVLIAFKAGTALIGCGSGGGHAGLSREETDLPNTDEWFYDSFDDTGKMAYDAFRKAAEEPFGEEPVPILGEKGESAEISVERLDQVYQGFLYDHPEVFWLSRTYRYRVSGGSGSEEFADAVAAVPLAGSSKELSEWKKEFESAAAQMLQGLDNTENDRDIAAALYSKLAAQTQYEEEAVYDESFAVDHTAYGAISEKRGVCDGIALAYKYLLAQCGIRCIVIPGESEGTAHVWNIVYWDDSWHEVDLTWDIVSEGNDRMQYFDLSTEEMNKDHAREKEGIAPAIPTAQ